MAGQKFGEKCTNECSIYTTDCKWLKDNCTYEYNLKKILASYNLTDKVQFKDDTIYLVQGAAGIKDYPNINALAVQLERELKKPIFIKDGINKKYLEWEDEDV